jgi:hypothetical protein
MVEDLKMEGREGSWRRSINTACWTNNIWVPKREKKDIRARLYKSVSHLLMNGNNISKKESVAT